MEVGMNIGGQRMRGAAGLRRGLRWRALALVIVGAGCAEPHAVRTTTLAVSATAEVQSNGVSQLRWIGTNTGREAIQLTGCPNAPAFYLESNLGTWFEVASIGVVCPANLLTTRLTIPPGATVSGSFGVATPGTYRFRVLVDAPGGGSTLTVTSNPVTVP
jgi:hypothetical protein